MGAAASAPDRDALDADDDEYDDGRLRIGKGVLFAVFALSFFVGTALITARVMAVFLVRTWFHQSSEAVIGPLTGVLLASFSAARVATPRAWAAACDATRSPKWLALAMSLLGGLCSAWFMLETSFWRALAARALAGALILPCTLVRCVVRAASPSARDEAAGMAARTLGLGTAVILVPPVLGALATPCERRYAVMRTHWCDHPTGWLVHRPFALTAAFTLAVGAAALTAAAVLLPNPRVSSACGAGERCGPPVDLLFRPHLRRAAGPDKLAAVAAAAVADAERGGALNPATSVAPAVSGAPPPARPPMVRPPTAPLPSVFESAASAPVPAAAKPPRALSGALSARAASVRRSATSVLQRAESAVRARAAAVEARLADAVIYAGTRGFAAADAAMANLDAAAGAALAQARSDGDAAARGAAARTPAPSATSSAPPPPWWRSRHAVAAVALYGAHTALHDGAFDLVSLTATARAPRDAVPGLKFSGLAWIVSLGGLALVLSSLVVYPRIARRGGPAAAVHAGLAVGTVGSAMLAGAASMMGPVPAVRALQGGAQFLYGASSGLASSGAQVVVNLAAPSRAVGAVNAAGNAASNAARVAAPLLAGGLWAIVAAPEEWAGWLPATLLAAVFAATLIASALSDTRDARGRVVY